jgi:hypothetical protein
VLAARVAVRGLAAMELAAMEGASPGR